jgi:hypothetical protein
MHPYMLLSYVEGRHGEEVKAENKKLIWSKLGEYARKNYSIEVSGFGERMKSPGVSMAVGTIILNTISRV